MNRRTFIRTTLTAVAMMALPRTLFAADATHGDIIEPITRSDDEWRQILTPEQFDVLRREGTERPFSSPLNKEYGNGTYLCAGCQLPLFDSDSKFDSGTGWPSFTMPISGHIETRRDFRLILPRTEYHCIRCGGHQGHVFDDGPAPTGQRWCNNGIALKFLPQNSS